MPDHVDSVERHTMGESEVAESTCASSEHESRYPMGKICTGEEQRDETLQATIEQ